MALLDPTEPLRQAWDVDIPGNFFTSLPTPETRASGMEVCPWLPFTWVSKTLSWSTTRALCSGIEIRPEDSARATPVLTLLRSMPPTTGLVVGTRGELSRSVKQFVSDCAEKGSISPGRFGCCHGQDQARGMIANYINLAVAGSSYAAWLGSDTRLLQLPRARTSILLATRPRQACGGARTRGTRLATGLSYCRPSVPINIEAHCAAPPEALAHSPSQMPLSCPVAPASQRELHKDGGGGGGGVGGGLASGSPRAAAYLFLPPERLPSPRSLHAPFTSRPPLSLGLPHQQRVSNVQRALGATIKKPLMKKVFGERGGGGQLGVGHGYDDLSAADR